MTQQLEVIQSTTQIAAAIESLLFVSGRPLEYAELRKLLDIDDASLTNGLQTLTHQLENARYIAALLDLPMTAKLTTSAMETLSVISYRQPITRAQIEAIRGVNSDRAVASLIQHGLIAEIGRAQTVGRPALFATTPEFLQQFGLTSLEQLPRTDMKAPLTESGRE